VKFVISPRRLIALTGYLLALVLLAGAPLPAAELPHEGLKQPGEIWAKSLGRDDYGRARALAGAADSADAEDNPDPLAHLVTVPDVAPTHPAFGTVQLTCPRAAPRTHWPCAGFPTGPPTR
jgi:hypothetical protein